MSATGCFDLGASDFGERLVSLNALRAQGFVAWEFLPGMRFGERAAWWREGAERDRPHEGLDIGYFRTAEQRRLSLQAGTRIPMTWAGTIVAVVPDFLGLSIFVAHPREDGSGRRLHTVFGHVAPRPGIAAGCQLREAELVGTIADPSGRKTTVPAHLHVTIALIACSRDEGAPDWATLGDHTRAALLDPWPLVCGRMPARASS